MVRDAYRREHEQRGEMIRRVADAGERETGRKRERKKEISLSCPHPTSSGRAFGLANAYESQTHAAVVRNTAREMKGNQRGNCCNNDLITPARARLESVAL